VKPVKPVSVLLFSHFPSLLSGKNRTGNPKHERPKSERSTNAETGKRQKSFYRALLSKNARFIFLCPHGRTPFGFHVSRFIRTWVFRHSSFCCPGNHTGVLFTSLCFSPDSHDFPSLIGVFKGEGVSLRRGLRPVSAVASLLIGDTKNTFGIPSAVALRAMAGHAGSRFGTFAFSAFFRGK
jgi:hypothetical protein